MLPDTSMFMALPYKGRVSIGDQGCPGARNNDPLSAAVLSGIRDSSRRIHYHENTANLLINFTPGAAAAFFREPVHELYDQSIPVEWLKNGAGFAFLTERLAETPTKKAQLALVEQTLLSTPLKPAPDPLVTSAIKLIGAANGNAKISALAKELFISRDALEKRFRGAVGTTPKHYSSILRLRNAIASHAPGKSLTNIALTAGYYDQAHFIRDFRAFTGQPPSQLFSEPDFW